MNKEKLLETLNNILPIFYKDNFEIIENDIIDVILYYPELTIKNSQGYSHKMYDLFFKVSFKNTTTQEYYLYLLNVTRTTLTEVEYANNYVFSHTNKPITTDWGNLCLGDASTPLGTLYSILKFPENLDEDTLEQLFLTIDNYLQWESLEGGPYRGIKNLYNISKRLVDVENIRYTCFDSSTEFKKLLKLEYFNINISNSNLLLQLSEEGEKNIINSILQNPILFALCSSRFILIHSQDNKEYILNNNCLEKNVDDAFCIKFKGKLYKLKILKEDVKKEKQNIRIQSNFREYINYKTTAEFNFKARKEIGKNRNEAESEIEAF